MKPIIVKRSTLNVIRGEESTGGRPPLYDAHINASLEMAPDDAVLVKSLVTAPHIVKLSVAARIKVLGHSDILRCRVADGVACIVWRKVK